MSGAALYFPPKSPAKYSCKSFVDPAQAPLTVRRMHRPSNNRYCWELAWNENAALTTNYQEWYFVGMQFDVSKFVPPLRSVCIFVIVHYASFGLAMGG